MPIVSSETLQKQYYLIILDNNFYSLRGSCAHGPLLEFDNFDLTVKHAYGA
jgi:hypothetical protein